MPQTIEAIDRTEDHMIDEIPEKYLTFHLGNESYGAPVLQVREIIRMQPITKVPHVASHLQGVINLRGKVVPVVCLREKFGLPRVEHDHKTCMIVVQIEDRENSTTVLAGLIVDFVDEAVNILPSAIEGTPDLGHSIDARYIKGITTLNGEVKTLLDLDAILIEDAALE